MQQIKYLSACSLLVGSLCFFLPSDMTPLVIFLFFISQMFAFLYFKVFFRILRSIKNAISKQKNNSVILDKDIR